MSREGYYKPFADIITSGEGEILGDGQMFSEHGSEVQGFGVV